MDRKQPKQQPDFDQARPPVPILSLDEGDIFFEVRGSGHPDSRWFTVINGLADVQAFKAYVWKPNFGGDSSTLLFDFPGQGNSTIKKKHAGIADLVRIVTALWDHLDIHESTVISLCLGCNPALWLTSHAPDRVKRLFLMNPSPGPRWYPVDMYNWSLDSYEIALRVHRLLAPAYTFDATLPYASRVIKQLETTDLKERQEYLRDIAHSVTPESLAPRVMRPTHLVQALDDQMISADAARHLKSIIPNATIDFIREAGHMFFANPSKNDACLTPLIQSYEGMAPERSVSL